MNILATINMVLVQTVKLIALEFVIADVQKLALVVALEHVLEVAILTVLIIVLLVARTLAMANALVGVQADVVQIVLAYVMKHAQKIV